MGNVPIWKISDVSVTVNGQTVDMFVSFDPGDGEDKVDTIMAPAPVAYEVTPGKPTWTLEVQPFADILSILYDLRDNKTLVPITFQTPAQVINYTNAIVASIKPGKAADKTPTVVISGFAMKKEERMVSSTS
ncbi:MAG: hypothetical protein LUQ71_10280 [Methanoregula sp.]|nr:hypothetical protein [Methanoregula sp.]